MVYLPRHRILLILRVYEYYCINYKITLAQKIIKYILDYMNL